MAAPTAAQKCQASKNKAAGKYAACRENAEAKLASTGDTTKYSEAITKCETKYQTAWQKAEQTAANAGGSCTTTGDQAAVHGVTDELTDNVAQHLGGAPLEDCPAELATCNAGTAAAGDVLSGKTFSSNAGLGVTGTMPNNGAANFTPGAAAVPVPAGYYSGGQVNTDANLVSGNIRSGASISASRVRYSKPAATPRPGTCCRARHSPMRAGPGQARCRTTEP